MPEMDGYMLGVAQRNKRIAEQNAQLAEQWMTYANKLKAKLSTVEQERDAVRRERDALAAQLREQQARIAALDALQGRMAAELEKVNSAHPLVSAERRKVIVETAIKMARLPQTRP